MDCKLNKEELKCSFTSNKHTIFIKVTIATPLRFGFSKKTPRPPNVALIRQE